MYNTNTIFLFFVGPQFFGQNVRKMLPNCNQNYWQQEKLVTEMNLANFQYISLFFFFSDYIETLPLNNTPEALGLHSNAEIGYYTQAARDMWNHLIELQPQTSKSESRWGGGQLDFVGH